MSDGPLNTMLDPDAIKLAEELDGLPLALATAGAYLNQTAISFSDYLRLYKASWTKLLKMSPELSSYEDRTLYSTWQLSFDHVNNGMNFQPSFFGFGHTLTIRISGLSFFSMAIRRTQSGYMNLPKMS